MAGSSFGNSISITREEFHLFHSIDRRLYARLIQNLGRNPGQSMEVMALWLWLERKGYSHSHYLVYDLLGWPDFMINAIADETVTCLNCIHDDDHELIIMPDSDADVIPFLRSFTNGGAGAAISLGFFKENRMAVLREVSELVDEVCVRAFDGIFPNINGILFGNPMNLGNPFPPLMDLLSPMCYSGVGDAMNRSVPPDERTIFLTFSKGYPLSKNELKDFFTKKYGDDVIEAIHMKEVNTATEQPLYARLVVRSPSSIEVILQGNRNAQFSINGKHVRARKFVKNNSRSPRNSLSPPSSGSTSPP